METNYPEVVQEIHKEFFTAGEALLAEVNEYLQNPPVVKQEKIDKLKSIGFGSSKDAIAKTKFELEAQPKRKLSDAVQFFRIYYPNYKFITEADVKRICKKYNLLHGPTSIYTGFVPEKNLDEILEFKKKHPQLLTEYQIMNNYGAWVNVSKAEYEKERNRIAGEKIVEKSPIAIPSAKDIMNTHLMSGFRYADNVNSRTKVFDASAFAQANQLGIQYFSASIDPYSQDQLMRQQPISYRSLSSAIMAREQEVSLNICSPLEDMKADGYTLTDGYKLELIHYPDPVVLCPVVHENGTHGSLIITAWGDEASDELVVDQNTN